MRVTRSKPAFIAAALVTGAIAAGHLLFAIANFGLAGDEEDFLSVPLGDSLFRRRVFRAGVVAFAGTSPLPIFYAFTVPEHSDWVFLFGSLVLPLLSGATALVSGRRGRS